MNPPTTRRQAMGLILGSSLSSAWATAGAASSAWHPTEMIRYTIGVAPGGSVDLYARGIKQALERMRLTHDQPILADNKPGAAGLLTLQQLQRARGNAHYLGTFHTGSIAGQATGMLKADMREFVPVAMLVEETTLLAVRADSPLRSVNDLLARLRQDPGGISFAVAPTRGLNTHLAIAKPLKAAGVPVGKLTVVPFRSSGESMTALLGGNVDVVSATSPSILPHVQSGKVRALVSVAAKRGTGMLATVPTWREHGVAVDYASYNGVLLPGGVDAEQIRFWEDALRQVAQAPEWKALVEKSGNQPMFKGYIDSHRYLEQEMADTRALVAALGLEGTT